jgi:CHAT domain-containing protein
MFEQCHGLVLLCLLGVLNAVGADGTHLVERGEHAFKRGAFEEAAADWREAAETFRRQANVDAELRTSVLLAGAYQALGQHRVSVEILEAALARAELTGSGVHLIRLRASLGAALVMTLELERARVLLQEALEAASRDEDRTSQSEIQNDLGNLLLVQQEYEGALAAYETSVALAHRADHPGMVARALCNAAVAAVRAGKDGEAEDLNAQALGAIEILESGHDKAFLLVTAGQTDRQIGMDDAETSRRLTLRAHRSFEQALDWAGRFGDLSIQTYALGYLAQLYEEDQQQDVALALTRRAAFAAQKGQMPEALYRWEWQTGRLLKRRGDAELAMVAYRNAVQTMRFIRNDVSLGHGNAVTRPSFREAEGPLFLELAELLLERAGSVSEPESVQRLLREARDTVESLKVAELEDYFCDDCVNVQRARTRVVETVDEQTAVIYLILLPRRIEILVGLTSGLSRFVVDVGAEEMTSRVIEFRRNLETRTTYGYLEQAQQLHEWIIRPIRELLATRRIHTLVFVPDGILRTIPFASLHDGERFLIEEWAVAVVPGLSMVEPKALQRGKVHVLLNGLSEPVQGFPPLPFVVGELSDLATLYRGDTLVNETFTLNTFRRALTDEQYSIIHVASHGQFDGDVRKTFVLTYDGKLTLNDLEALIRPSQYRGRPVEFLVLSACQTAAGDDRAALGLAGVAVKAGARSALATLWFVNDQSTSTLVSEVYRQLRRSPTISKAQALQAAQLKLLGDRRYRHPCYWSPYLMIGNWL